jgi:hypothetical protein
MRSGCAALLGLLACLVQACAGGQRAKGLEPLEGLDVRAVGEALRPRRLALLIGINRFQDARWPSLKHAQADARALGELLADPGLGGFDSVEVLAGEEGVDRVEVEAALERLAAANASAEDTVLVYFSTHGSLARAEGGELGRYLVASDSLLERLPATGLGLGEVLGRFDGLASRRKVLVLATCHSGAGKSFLPAPLSRELEGVKGAFFAEPLGEVSQASMVLAACAFGETAREDDRLGHDIYTYFLMESLRAVDRDRDGVVTASEAHAHAMSSTYYYSGGLQRPQVEARVLGADPIVLAGAARRPSEAAVFSFLPRLHGLVVTVNGRDKGVLPGRLVLPPGRHRLEVREPDEGPLVAVTELELAAGQEVSVESLLAAGAPPEPVWQLDARAGYQRFLTAAVREGLIAPMALFGLSVSRLRFPAEFLETVVDLQFTGASQRLVVGGRPVEQQAWQLGYGLQVLLRLDLGPLGLLLGPRLAGVHVFRDGVNPDGTNQVFSTFSPGLVGRVRLAFDFGLSLDAEVRVQFLSVHTPGEALDTGFIDVLAGLGWRF